MSMFNKPAPGVGKLQFRSADLDSEVRKSREGMVCRELSARLGPTLDHLSRVDFDVLILKIARVQLKGEGRV